MFGSEPRHPFWLDVLDEMQARAGRPVARDEDVLETTGPGMLTDVYHRDAARDPRIRLLRNESLRCARCGGISCRFGEFAAHLHAGSWRGVRPAPRSAAHDDPLVLRTYRGDVHDGLSSVFASASTLGPVVDDTRDTAGHRVLVAGIPFLYAAKLSPRNVNVAYTTFESTRLPQHWVAALNAHYHVCAVPHDAVARVFRDSGVRIPLHVVPQGFTRYPRAPRRPPEDVFRIGFIGVPVRRKNLRTLFDACVRLRRAIPALRLAVHVARWYDWLDASAWRDVAAAPFVEWSEGVRSRDEIAAWYASLSCYAYPSSAEGWSFTPRESMYLGVPTVVSAIPVHDDLVRSGFCTVIPARGREPAVYEGGVFGEWSAIGTDDAVRALLGVHDDPAAAESKALDGARWIDERWSGDEMLRGLRGVLERA
jgi:glycosyltransferase involved in cell wall biosynthesis